MIEEDLQNSLLTQFTGQGITSNESYSIIPNVNSAPPIPVKLTSEILNSYLFIVLLCTTYKVELRLPFR